jgi:hypothetical protein
MKIMLAFLLKFKLLKALREQPIRTGNQVVARLIVAPLQSA